VDLEGKEGGKGEGGREGGREWGREGGTEGGRKRTEGGTEGYLVQETRPVEATDHGADTKRRLKN
jgi:hypothetical protein